MTTSTENPVLSENRVSLYGTLSLMFVSGFFATLAFDLWGQVISPALGFGALSPPGLARSLLGALGLPNSYFAGYFTHFYLVGLIGYPLGWLFVFRPIWSAIDRWDLPTVIPAAIYGFGLWIFAIGGMTYVAGLPFFLNFGTIIWVALVGHVLYALVLVATLEQVRRR